MREAKVSWVPGAALAVALGVLPADPAKAQPGCASSPAPQPDTTHPKLAGRMVFQSGGSLYLTDFGRGTTSLIALSTSSGPLRQVTNANFSPDGRWIIFSAVWGSGGGRRDVFVSRPDGSRLVNLTYDPTNNFASEDARFWVDGKTVFFKQRYTTLSATVGAIMTMQLTLPTDATTNPSRVGRITSVPKLDDGIHEFSQVSVSPSGKYLYYSVGSGSGERTGRLNTQTGAATALGPPTIYSYFPVSVDFTTTFYTGRSGGSNPHDQIFTYAPSLGITRSALPFNDPNADNADPAPVDEDFVIFSSNRCGGPFSLFIGQLGTSRYWRIGFSGVTVTPAADMLGSTYTLKPGTG
jgi:Tol biopolymer transport system component